MTQAFNLSQLANKVNSSGELDLATGVTGTLPVNEGGTGQTTYTNGQLLIGNTTGNTLTKSTLTAGTGITITNGTGSITIDAASGQLQTQLFTAPGTWTRPSSTTQVRVTVVGGGAGGQAPNVGGGFGGFAIAMVPVSAPVAITIGAGGGVASSGGTSSFGPAVSATGGSVALPGGTNGNGTVSVGTALRTSTSAINISSNLGILSGNLTNGVSSSSTPATPYSTSGTLMAGGRGSGAANTPQASGGVGGAVVVEWVS